MQSAATPALAEHEHALYGIMSEMHEQGQIYLRLNRGIDKNTGGVKHQVCLPRKVA